MFEVSFTNVDKVLWPDDGYTKADLIKYYIDVAPYILPHLLSRPLVLTRYPNGIHGKWFYQKNAPDNTPSWIKTATYEHKDSVINYILADNPEALAWLANQGCIEIHPWLSTISHPGSPDFMVLDIDPMPPTGFREAAMVAIETKKVLDVLGLNSWVKTSGATGIHIYIPIETKYSYKEVVKASIKIAKVVWSKMPDTVTLERTIAKRGPKVYFDCYQNGLGKTLAGPYSVRPREKAPVSTPLLWEELYSSIQKGSESSQSGNMDFHSNGENKHLDPEDFNIESVPDRLRRTGDPFEGILTNRMSLERVLNSPN